ncbi:DNA polymerase III subunit beta [Anaerocolumna cellulosilytica]|uniref:Beta sliding clamp n=1 Tax=Anaerocolumna cellulosilytica TaxID=433286 RepID=A0A6S6QM57_9FIRM|nr:DNA polymerase III subunit beta [Anaerocolumna cellulosilytica]MBB5195949.1 DNA polymerase-3 subunit beta [Anaerocolumna cellulosilytica]BCJ92433.1 DNA polymerase III subunit beta [Anaerocolumna cellulosilytica]
MKIVCSKTELQNRVNIVLKAVPAKSTMPILECLIIDVKSDTIKLIANDMELGIETIVKGEVIETGTVAINAKVFSEIIRKLPDNDVTIETDGNYLTTILCEKAKFAISGKSSEEFPYLPKVEKQNAVVLSQFTLKEIIRQTVFSISDNESNKIMTGELFEITGNELKVVSLDGHRISIRKIELKEEYEDIKVIVPGKTLIEVSKILSGEFTDEVNLYFTDKHIIFEFDNTVVLSRLIEGEYYKINQMLSSDYETKVTINKKELLSCIDRATLLIKETEKKPIIVKINDKNMELKMNSTIGSMDEEIDITKEGKDIVIGFNPKFLIEALRVIDDEEVDIYLINPKAPCFIRDKEERYIYLILPVNFNSAVQ